MNRLFVVNKPIFISSNNYMYYVKRKYGTKKVGFSGTLDPFATGCLIVATGTFTKLFQYLKKSPKSYIATVWLGVESDSLDIENVTNVGDCKVLDIDSIKEVLESLKGTLEYLPPKYSAKKINGKRAYELARESIDIELKKIKSDIYSVELLNYKHPFITFKIEVSEGAYIRSIAQIVASKLGVKATLSALSRVNEGEFKFKNEKPLNPYRYLKIKSNYFLDNEEILELGQKLNINQFKIQEDGIYLVQSSNFYSIIEISNDKISYKLNRLPKEYN